jgi:predicted acyltransferase
MSERADRHPMRVRVRSVDALRGLVVALMIFVNSLAEVPQVPAFTQHLPASVDGYSLADMILPWFLFLVGVSLPLALGHFVAAQRRWSAFSKIVPRVAGLALLGVIFVNTERIAAERSFGLSGNAWFLLTVGLLLVLLVIRAPGRPTLAPVIAQASVRRAAVGQVIKIAAAIVLVGLLVIYRGRDPGQTTVTWLRPQWWGILGIIGWSYLVGAVAYLVTRGARIGLAALLCLSVAVAIATAGGLPPALAFLQAESGVHEFFGSYACLVLAGTIAGTWLSAIEPGASWRDRLATSGKLALLGVASWLVGWLLHPLHGYHKLGSTESWALVAAGQAALLLAGFHLWLDRSRDDAGPGDRLGQWLADAGSNALLAYLLSELQVALAEELGLTAIGAHAGLHALLNAGLLSLLFIALSAAATRARIRLRL